jgi:hypothetical protein
VTEASSARPGRGQAGARGRRAARRHGRGRGDAAAGAAAREPLRLAAMAVVDETKRLARAVVEAAHRVPGPEDV